MPHPAKDLSAPAPQPGPDSGAPGTQQMAPALAQVLSRRTAPTPGEACEMCVAPVPQDHRHVVDLERRSLLCSCRGCALLFEFSGSSHGRYRTVPDRYLRIEPFSLPPQAWVALQIPVGMCFVVGNTQLGRSVAFYPSPGGATESELPLDAWGRIVAANAGLEDAEPDVEAVLIRTGDVAQCHVVPVDRCYELVGVLRLHWRGFDGGSEVREHLAAFFSDIEHRSRRASGSRKQVGGR